MEQIRRQLFKKLFDNHNTKVLQAMKGHSFMSSNRKNGIQENHQGRQTSHKSCRGVIQG
jgi:hypothetical protein